MAREFTKIFSTLPHHLIMLVHEASKVKRRRGKTKYKNKY